MDPTSYTDTYHVTDLADHDHNFSMKTKKFSTCASHFEKLLLCSRGNL